MPSRHRDRSGAPLGFVWRCCFVIVTFAVMVSATCNTASLTSSLASCDISCCGFAGCNCTTSCPLANVSAGNCSSNTAGSKFAAFCDHNVCTRQAIVNAGCETDNSSSASFAAASAAQGQCLAIVSSTGCSYSQYATAAACLGAATCLSSAGTACSSSCYLEASQCFVSAGCAPTNYAEMCRVALLPRVSTTCTATTASCYASGGSSQCVLEHVLRCVSVAPQMTASPPSAVVAPTEDGDSNTILIVLAVIVCLLVILLVALVFAAGPMLLSRREERRIQPMGDETFERRSVSGGGAEVVEVPRYAASAGLNTSGEPSTGSMPQLGGTTPLTISRSPPLSPVRSAGPMGDPWKGVNNPSDQLSVTAPDKTEHSVDNSMKQDSSGGFSVGSRRSLPGNEVGPLARAKQLRAQNVRNSREGLRNSKGERPPTMAEAEDKRCRQVVRMLRANEYQKGKLLGKGSNGSVYTCILSDGSMCAMKQLDASSFSTGESRAVAEELRLMSTLRNPHIIRYYHAEYDESQQVISLWMELIQGGSLGGMVRRLDESLGESVVRAYARQIALGLKYLHQNHIVHRDIKGDNILLEADGRVKLADFGSAKNLLVRSRVGGAGSPVPSVMSTVSPSTKYTDTIVGTPLWMAPEVVNPDREGSNSAGYSLKADVWSFGITVAELLNNGLPPWPDFPSAWQALFHIGNLTEAPELPTCSVQARAFLDRCLQVNPDHRASASELLLHPWLAEADTFLTSYDMFDDGAASFEFTEAIRRIRELQSFSEGEFSSNPSSGVMLNSSGQSDQAVRTVASPRSEVVATPIIPEMSENLGAEPPITRAETEPPPTQPVRASES